MREWIQGRCHCGENTYEAKGEKKFEFFCHCEDCRVLNGGGRLSGIAFLREAFSFQGEPSIYKYNGGSGKPLEVHFCSKCGTGLFAFIHKHPEVVIVRANTLSNSDIFKPRKSLFPEQAFDWDSPLK